MSNKNKHRAFRAADTNVQITAPTPAPAQEKTMEATQQDQAEQTKEAQAEPIGPTAKQLAAAEEENAVRARRLIELQNSQGTEPQPVSVIGLAAQGREALLEGLRQHAAHSKPKEYVPPPRTARQMSQLEEELEAGRRSQEKAQAQLDARPIPPRDPKEGFTTPVFRPNDVVPDPTVPATIGRDGMSAAGTRKYGPDAP
jgi:hypothetical protein